MLGITGGTSLLDAGFITELKATVVKSRYGTVHVLKNTRVVFLPRHGKDHRTPPHMINHKANMQAMSDLGVEEVVGINSAGSLNAKLRPCSIIIPEDFICFGKIETIYDTEIRHVTPGIDEGLRKRIIAAAEKAKVDAIEGGVYAQTAGPRLETRAEVRFLADYADVVGMTLASEATLACELNLRFASICTVDNYANGIAGKKLNFTDIMRDAKKNQERLKKILFALLEERK
jgi:5'-methylthioadenosine phosphorylase